MPHTGRRVERRSAASGGSQFDRGRPRLIEVGLVREVRAKPDMPVWFVFFDKRKGIGAGKKAAEQTAGVARQYRGMHVTYSPGGEYTHSVDEIA